MCDTNCSAMRPCGGPFCPYDTLIDKSTQHISSSAGNTIHRPCVETDKETPASFAEQTQVVIPLAQWRRLVELVDSLQLAAGNMGVVFTGTELEDLIASVEVPDETSPR